MTGERCIGIVTGLFYELKYSICVSVLQILYGNSSRIVPS